MRLHHYVSERAQHFRQLGTVCQVSPSFFEAPSIDGLTIVFTYGGVPSCCASLRKFHTILIDWSVDLSPTGRLWPNVVVKTAGR